MTCGIVLSFRYWSEMECLDLGDNRFGAMIKGGVKVLDAMVHERLPYTHSSGSTDTKPS